MRQSAGPDGRRRHASRRRAALRGAAAAAKVDALLVSLSEDVRYLTGFTGDDSHVLVGNKWAVLVTDGRYAEQAAAECGDVEMHVRKAAADEVVAEVARKHKVRRLGFQAEHVTVQRAESLAGKLGRKRVRSVAGIVSRLRAVKDAGELGAIRKSVRVAQRAFRGLMAGGARGLVGRSERDVAAELDYRMRLAGAEKSAFETIVAAGPHGSLPHYRPGGRRIRPGDPVLVDWGAKVNGYCSDLTRVVFVSTIPPKLAEIHEVVRQAQAAGIAALRPGAGCKSADAAARKVIRQAGYGKQFVHGLGHGVGLAVHEAPGLGGKARGRLRSGTVVTVEPGIYLPGVGGVRIEDDVLVAPDGPHRLSSLPRTAAAMILR